MIVIVVVKNFSTFITWPVLRIHEWYATKTGNSVRPEVFINTFIITLN